MSFCLLVVMSRNFRTFVEPCIIGFEGKTCESFCLVMYKTSRLDFYLICISKIFALKIEVLFEISICVKIDYFL